MVLHQVKRGNDRSSLEKETKIPKITRIWGFLFGAVEEI